MDATDACAVQLALKSYARTERGIAMYILVFTSLERYVNSPTGFSVFLREVLS